MIEKDNYNISLYKRRIDLTPALGHVATSSSVRSKNLDIFKSNYLTDFPEYIKCNSFNLNRSFLEFSIENFSEQSVARPIDDLAWWYKFRTGRFFLPGYPRLYYNKGISKVSSNKTAVAAIGEGLAGLITQWVYKCHTLARPNHDFPDVVMRNNNHIFLVEAKAVTDNSKIKVYLEKFLRDMISYTHTCDNLDGHSVVGLLYGTQLVDDYNFEVYINEIVNPLTPNIVPNSDYIHLNNRKIMDLHNELSKNLNSLTQENIELAQHLLDQLEKDKSKKEFYEKLKSKDHSKKIDDEFIKRQIYNSNDISENIKKDYGNFIDGQLKAKSETLEFIDENFENIVDHDVFEIRKISNKNYQVNSFSIEAEKLNYCISPMDLDVSHINEDSIRQSNREWFPYDFTMDGYFNIIDQDGSLRIYTDKSEKDGSIDDSIDNIIKYVY